MSAAQRLSSSLPRSADSASASSERNASRSAVWAGVSDTGNLPSGVFKTDNSTTSSVVAGGGGMQAVIEPTGLRTLENVVRLIDPAILKRALDNDVLERGQHPQV
jgi:hypothetical protein